MVAFFGGRSHIVTIKVDQKDQQHYHDYPVCPFTDIFHLSCFGFTDVIAGLPGSPMAAPRERAKKRRVENCRTLSMASPVEPPAGGAIGKAVLEGES